MCLIPSSLNFSGTTQEDAQRKGNNNTASTREPQVRRKTEPPQAKQNLFKKKTNGRTNKREVNRKFFPKLASTFENFINYIQEIKNDSSGDNEPMKESARRIMHSTETVLQPLLLKIQSKSKNYNKIKKDFGVFDVVDFASDFFNEWLTSGRVHFKLRTILKYVKSFKHFGNYAKEVSNETEKVDYAHKMDYQIQTFSNFCFQDRMWMQQKVESQNKKNENLIPFEKVIDFLVSEDVKKVIDSAVKYYKDMKSTQQNLSKKNCHSFDGETKPTQRTATKLRNVLMTVMVSEPARRNQEITTLVLGNIKKPYSVLEKGGVVLISALCFKVKNLAQTHFAVSFQVYLALVSYITYYRPLLCNDSSEESPLFPNETARKETNLNFDHPNTMTFPNVTKIIGKTFQKMEIMPIECKNITSRAIRSSYSTAFERFNPRNKRMKRLSRVQANSLDTQLRYYAIPSDAVTEVKNFFSDRLVVGKHFRLSSMEKLDYSTQLEELTSVNHIVRKYSLERNRLSSSDLEKKEQLLFEDKITKNCEDGLIKFRSSVSGRGVKATKNFKKKEFVVEYKGELISGKEAEKRNDTYEKDPSLLSYLLYFNWNGEEWCVDATKETKYLGRLVNHAPGDYANLKPKMVVVNGVPHVIFLALKDIAKGDEIFFDYGERNQKTLAVCPWLKKSSFKRVLSIK